MTMYDPPHPGDFIREVYLEPFGNSIREVAKLLDVAPSTFSRLARGDSDITPRDGTSAVEDTAAISGELACDAAQSRLMASKTHRKPQESRQA